ncbi:hypothetical protein OAG44_00025 [bacterium]|jgi:hypothetical protein|nr:hypothetical protein [bacterium]
MQNTPYPDSSHDHYREPPALVEEVASDQSPIASNSNPSGKISFRAAHLIQLS